MEMPPAPWPATPTISTAGPMLVAQHPVWARVADADRERLRVRAAELAVALAWTRRDGLFRLADDPWQDLDLAAPHARPARRAWGRRCRPTSS